MMPTFIQPIDDSAEARAAACGRLAAHMLNMEKGAIAWGTSVNEEGSPQLVRLGEPHSLWPLIEVPPVTRDGLACLAHYKPACGVVYYSGRQAGDVLELVRALADMLRPHVEHLCVPRAAGASLASVLLVTPPGRSTVVTGPAAPYRRSLPAGGARDARPARLLHLAAAGMRAAPPACSARATFTWIFLPLSAVISISEAPTESANAVNALVAGLVYDEARLFTHADGDSPPTVALSSARTQVATHDFWRSVGTRRPPAFANFTDNYALHLSAAGVLTYLGDGCALTPCRSNAVARRVAIRALKEMPVAPMPDNITGCCGGARKSACACCLVPIGGSCVLVPAPVCPASFAQTRFGRERGMVDGSSLARWVLGAPTAALLCDNCWLRLEPPGNGTTVEQVLRTQFMRVEIPWSQADAAEALGLLALAAILRGRVTRLAPGAWAVALGDVAAPPDPWPHTVVLAGDPLGPWPQLDHPALMVGTVIVPYVHLAEDA